MRFEANHPALPGANCATFAGASPHRRQVLRLLAIIAGSILFTIALVPFYNVLCRVTGLNGRTGGDDYIRAESSLVSGEPALRVDYGRVVRIEFTGTVMPGLPWRMTPLTPAVSTHPGELQVVKYRVRNMSDRPTSGQAIPGITPGEAAPFFHKIECFCFAHQTLAPFEERDMAVVFVIKPDMNPDVGELTLAYAFFPVAAARIAQVTQIPSVRSALQS
ncbi:MAG TPA: cytochrome c oxidase assembly protein [Rhodocyclaceae bacterium]|nr:cytochrome c oxidase assembly protein [Rhodocyclaceae bacterium]